MGPTVAFVSFRLGGSDGVSVEAEKWRRAFAELGFSTMTVAGAGHVDRTLEGLAIGASDAPTAAEVDDALADADLVVVENLCSLPLNPGAGRAVAAALRGRAAVLHHHDLAWQRPATMELREFPPDDPAWAHVTINHLSRRQLGERGVVAVTIYNCFDPDPAPGDREGTRARLGVAPDERVLLHPVRAIPRKNVPAALALAEGLGATYWLLGPAEDGYGAELARLLAGASTPVVHGTPSGVTTEDAYAAADAVALPSTWEGFGNATVESAVYRRPLAIAPYPVAREIAAYGFRWFPAGDPRPLNDWLAAPDDELLRANHAIARHHFSVASLPDRLAAVVTRARWGGSVAGAVR